jgi:diguanylate cyclase (GGDEF)-like protein
MNDSDLGEGRVLAIAAERESRELIRSALSRIAMLESVAGLDEARAQLVSASFDLVILDLAGSEEDAAEFLERMGREFPQVECLVLAPDDSTEDALARSRSGHADYLVKPVPRARLRRRVEEMLSRLLLVGDNRRLRDALHTAEACRALGPCLDPGKVYPLAMDLLLQTMSRNRAVAMFERNSIPLGDAVAFRGISELEAGRLREILLEKKPIDARASEKIECVDRAAIQSALREAGVEAQPMLSVPVHGPDTEAGVIWIFEDGRPFDAGEIERAGVVAGYAVDALRNAERYHHAKERAFIDDVTGVYNARYLLSATDNEMRRADRYGSALSVLFLDLDRFKTVNDRFGHLVGSDCLRQLSEVLLQCAREVDTLARYGGDEFTILLVDTDLETAMSVAERIRRTVEQHVFEAGREGSLRLTISIGVSTYPQHGETRDLLLDNADKAMYRAKSLGRNSVCSAQDL